MTIVGGRNVVIQNRSNRNTQIFFFDGKSRTVRSQAFKNQNLSINGGHRSRRGGSLEISRTNNGWW